MSDPLKTITLEPMGDGRFVAEHAGQRFTCGRGISELAKLALELVAAGAPEDACVVDDGLYYDLRTIARCHGAIHWISVGDTSDEQLLEEVNEWLNGWSERHRQIDDAPWSVWTDQLCANLLGCTDMLLAFYATPLGREAAAEFRQRFSGTRMTFPSPD